jgi:hypothetical protein
MRASLRGADRAPASPTAQIPRTTPPCTTRRSKRAAGASDGSLEPADHLGRACARLEGTATLDVELVDGAIEVDMAVGPERAFPGVFWRGRGAERFESFFVRPHQVGNPDAVQYTPVFNGLSSWQLYHGPGFGAPVEFPIGGWFRIRVAFAGARAEVHVAGELALVAPLRLPVEGGRVGVAAGSPPVHVASFAYSEEPGDLRAPEPTPAVEGIVEAWEVSDPFPERELDPDGRTWTRLEAEPNGLVDLSRAHGIRDGRNTVLARATIRAERARTVPLELGFSDRVLVLLNGRPLFRGADAYRSRDYRFLGSIGWYDTVYLPLEAGDNELVLAVSEDFGGWGVQARLPDRDGLTV